MPPLRPLIARLMGSQPRRLLVPPLRGPTPHAGSWGLPGPNIRRPVTPGMEQYAGLQRVQIRTGEGTATGVVPASKTITLSAGPQGLNTWYASYAAISTSTGAADGSTAALIVGPISAGLAPGGQSYAGGGDSIGLAGQVLRPGDYITITWTNAKPGDTATLTVYGEQDIPV